VSHAISEGELPSIGRTGKNMKAIKTSVPVRRGVAQENSLSGGPGMGSADSTQTTQGRGKIAATEVEAREGENWINPRHGPYAEEGELTLERTA
jgi:hypothetical protein